MLHYLKALIIASFVILTLNPPALAIDRDYLLVQNRADAVSLDDLGFDSKQTTANPEEENLLKERKNKLQLHQKLGLLTLALVAATAATAEEGKKAPESHESLGMLSGVSYFTTAYFSLTAPELESSRTTKKGWNMTLHKAMAFIHFPAMLLLPFAGKQASDAYRDGKTPTGLGKHKKTLANAAVASLGVAALSVAFDF